MSSFASAMISARIDEQAGTVTVDLRGVERLSSREVRDLMLADRALRQAGGSLAVLVRAGSAADATLRAARAELTVSVSRGSQAA